MEEEQHTNGNAETAPDEDVPDENETRLIIDESSQPSEAVHEKFKFKRKTRHSKLKSRKDVQEIANIYPCPDCGKTFKRKAKLETHFLTHKSKGELECEKCKRKFRKVDTLFSHECSGFGNNYKCSECGEWFRLKRDLVLHQQSHKQESCDELSDEKNPAEEIDFSAFVASFVKWPVPCKECGAELVNLHHYNDHMAAHKKGGPNYFCLRCKTKFTCKDDYLLHKVLCHIEGIFECTFCCKRFHTEKRLSDHLESHSGEGVVCDVCGLRFVNKEKLSAHKTAHSTSIFVCAKCKKIFRCNSSLRNHNCAPEKNEKKLYTFDDRTEKGVDEQCQDSLSTIEDSDSEDADISGMFSKIHLCKVCGKSFHQSEDLMSHLTTHFQCVQCKKYFKSRADLDMHKFLLAEERLYSCCLCEAIVHGKKELESHVSSHLATEDDLLDALESDDNTEILQNITSYANKPLHSSSHLNIKIHKVIPAGRNILRCSNCSKVVMSHHNLSAHIESSTPAGDSDEEYVYISRLRSPPRKSKQTEQTYCLCQNGSGSFLASLIEENNSQSMSFNEYDQETKNFLNNSQIPTYLDALKCMVNESVSNKSKLPLNQIAKNSSTVLDNNVGKSDEAVKSEREDFQLVMNSVNSTKQSEKSKSLSSISSVKTISVKKDSNKLPDNSKANLSNIKAEDQEDSQKQGIKVIKLDSSKSESASSKSNTKEPPGNSNSGKESVPAPVRIFVMTSGLSSSSANNEDKESGSVSELPADDKQNKSSPVKTKLTFRKILPKMNVVSQGDSALPSPKTKGGQCSEGNVSSPTKKIKIETATKKLPLGKFTDNTAVAVPSKINAITVKTFECEKISPENRSHNAIIEKNRNTDHQSLHNSASVTEPVVSNPIRKYKTFNKARLVVVKDRNTKPSSRSHIKQREQGKNIIRRNPSNMNANFSASHFPEPNMVVKLEKLSSDSEEEDDDSLDFSGIKKEFLASDVLIKEEWDIVDF